MKAGKIVDITNMGFGEDVVCFKLPYSLLAGNQFVVVPEGWQALVFSQGQFGEVLKRGKHRLSNLFKKNGQTDLIFYPTHTQFSFLWGTPQQMNFTDPVYNLPVKLGSNGQLFFTVKNMRKLFFVMGEFKKTLTTSQIKEKVTPQLLTFLQQQLATAVQEENISFLQLDFAQYVNRLNAALLFFLQNQFGLGLSSMLVKGTIFDKTLHKRLEKAAQQKQLEEQKQKNQNQQIVEIMNKQLEVESWQKTEKQKQKLQNQIQKSTSQLEQDNNEAEQEGLLLLS